MQLRFAHFVHGGHPELVVEQKFDALLLVRNLAERVRGKFSIPRSIQDLSCRTEGHWRALLLEDLCDLGPMELFSVAFDHVGEVAALLLTEVQALVKFLRLCIHLVLVLADKVLNKVTERLVNEIFLGIALLKVLNLLVGDLFDAFHVQDQELVLVCLS